LFTGGKFWWLYFLLLPVMWARMEKRRHTLAQLIAGALLAVVVVGTTLWVLGYRLEKF